MLLELSSRCAGRVAASILVSRIWIRATTLHASHGISMTPCYTPRRPSRSRCT